MTYPILEHDPAREAFVEPTRVIKERDMPERCVICFFSDVIEKVVSGHDASMIVENRWEDGPHPVYEIEYQGRRLAFFHPGIGSALAAALLEEVIAFGGRYFIACGGCGVLEKEIAAGQLLVVSAALRDEGASYHYLPPAREVTANPYVRKVLVDLLAERGIPHRVGKTWTTAAPYRETPTRIQARKKEGCLAVEMEAAGLMAVAEFRGAPFGQILYAGDDLSGLEWDNRG